MGLMSPVLRAAMAARSAWYPPGVTLAIDFESKRYFWGGQERSFADFTVAAGDPTVDDGYTPASADRLKLPNLGMINPFGGVIEVEYEYSGALSGTQQTVFSMSGSFGPTQSRFEAFVNTADSSQRLFVNYYNGSALVTVDTFNASFAASPPTVDTARRKRVYRWRDGEKLAGAAAGVFVLSGWNNYGVDPSEARRWAANGVGYRVLFNDSVAKEISIKRIFIWPDMTDEGMRQRTLITPKTNVHILGDSYVTANLSAEIVGALGPDYRAVRRDGVGGSTLAEQAVRYAATPLLHDFTLLIVDGGLSDADPIDQIAAIVAHNTSGRWAYMQSGYAQSWTPAQVSARLAVDAAIKAAYPDNFIDTYDFMRANGGGGTVGANGGEVWALDNYLDAIHMDASGEANLGACVANWLTAKGW